MKTFYSHKDKLLETHLKGVVEKTKNRTHLKIAEIAALFHDLGKINPNFQRKLNNEKNVDYSNHAYLSALAWLCFFEKNKQLVKELLNGEKALLYSVATMIARHHGNLPNLTEGFFNKDECERLGNFVRASETDDLPISEFLQQLLSHSNFHVKIEDEFLKHLLQKTPLMFEGSVLPKISDKLEFFLNTQFGFACLLESDKRDASDNQVFKRKDFSANFSNTFSASLAEKFRKLSQDSEKESDEKKRRLDALRSAMREESLANLREHLANSKRVFTLPAPTGAGKTLMLLSLANEILKHDENLSIIYALPFLAITEQTEDICRSILKENTEAVLRIDSKSENREIEKIQNDLDANPTDDNRAKLVQECFSERTFDHPFIITTFVQVFETLLSNRNATLLRLPNFSKTIFLLDEIQALPPNLYTFFVAYLDEFCRKFDSYAIVSTATMPHLKMPNEEKYSDGQKPSKVFKRYEKPLNLLSEKFYSSAEFNRYRISPIQIENLEQLASEIRRQKKSCLVVLNIVSDTKELHKLLNGNEGNVSEESEYILLNTHFTLEDRQRKLSLCKERLENNKRVILISTQLIEAGVDIDFPMLYRDMCPLPSLIQSAGRCNRNGRLETGEVFLFELKRENRKSSAELIYGRNFDWFLSETRNQIQTTLYEKDLLGVQQKFAEKINENLTFGLYKYKSKDKEKRINLVECINQMRFADCAKVKLIEQEYGKEFRYYVPDGWNDESFENLQRLVKEGKEIPRRAFAEVADQRRKIERQLRKMSSRIVNLRLSEKQAEGLTHLGSEECCEIKLLINQDINYSPVKGIILKPDSAYIF